MPETLDEIKKYVGPFSGPQMDQIFYEILNYTSERFAKGTAGGVPVAAGTPGYNDNSLFYKNQAAAQVSLAQAAAADAANSAQRAESAVPAGTDAAVLWTRDQSTELTADDKAVARKNIMAGGSNPNLLMNPWFTVNQRGFTSTSTNNTYTVDRWLAQNMRTAGVCSWSEGVITLDATNAVGGGLTFSQAVDIDEMAGREVSLSVMLANGNTYSKSVVLPARGTSQTTVLSEYIGSTTNIMRLYVNGSTSQTPYNVQFIVPLGNILSIKAVKLELGSVSTLANDAPPCYAAELAKCQRYFIRYKSTNYMYLATGFATAATVLNFTLINSLRAAARTVSFSNLTVTNGANSYAVTNLTAAVQDEGLTRLQAVVASGLTYGSPYAIQLNPNGYIDISADI